MEGHCRRRGGLRPTLRKSARQLCGTDFHKLHSMGHRYKEGIKRGEGIGREYCRNSERECPYSLSAFVSYSLLSRSPRPSFVHLAQLSTQYSFFPSFFNIRTVHSFSRHGIICISINVNFNIALALASALRSSRVDCIKMSLHSNSCSQ